jgi:CRISPR-associated endonuclease Cas2
MFRTDDDVPNDDHRRTRLAKALSQLGTRRKLSVFLLEDRTVVEVTRLLTPLLNEEVDNLCIQPLCATCAGKPVLLGRARQSHKPDGYFVI